MLALALAAAAVVAASAGAASAGAAGATVPLPTSDPFYAVPAGIAGLANGTVLASRAINAVAGPVPMPAHAWEVKYKTLDNHGHATATVTTVLVPDAAWTGIGERPLVSYQTAEDGVGAKCSPSYALHAGLASGDSDSDAETSEMYLALLKGWAVVAPDYEGLHSDFLGAAGEAHGVLDGITAALHFKPAGFTSKTPVAMWGYSGGALATSLAAQSQPGYARHLRFAAIALGGEVPDIKATLNAFNGTDAGGGIVVGLVGLDRSYPGWHLEQYLNAAGRQVLAANQSACIADTVASYPFLNISNYVSNPNFENLPQLTAELHSASPLWIPGTPSAPVYDYHATGDELAPVGPDRELAARYCAAGVRVDHVEFPVGEHISEVVTGAPGALSYLADRFAGEPAPDTCPPGSVRPAAQVKSHSRHHKRNRRHRGKRQAHHRRDRHHKHHGRGR
jgi:hypothetical protein